VQRRRSPVSKVVRAGPELDAHAAFTDFVNQIEPRLRRALVAARGPNLGRDATAEALAWAWEHWPRVQAMDNPAGYLFRVGQSKTRQRRRGWLQQAPASWDHVIEPGLGAALAQLSDQQRTAVLLVHGCGWTYHEVAEALGVSRSSVGTHVARALTSLRNALEPTTALETHDD
jgi:DNA-directed RNA polymerase specialized sigma24 family protein